MSQGKQLLLALAITLVVTVPLIAIYVRMPRRQPASDGLYGMSVDKCVTRWGKPNDIVNPAGPVSALVYDAAGVRVIIGAHGRVIRFDDAAGNRLNSYHADEKLRGLR